MLDTNYNYLIGAIGQLPSDFDIKKRIDPDSVCKELYDDIISAFFSSDNENKENNIYTVENWKQQYGGKHPFYTIRINEDSDCILLSSDYIGPSVYWAQQEGISIENIRDFLGTCRTIGGHMVWPRGSDITWDGTLTINTAKGGDGGVYDRIDWTLLLIKIYYSFPKRDDFFQCLRCIFPAEKIDMCKSSFLRMYGAISRAYTVWFSRFGSFERFCDQFMLNGSFVDETFRVKKMIDWFPLLPNPYMEYINNLCQAIQNRNRAITKKQ